MFCQHLPGHFRREPCGRSPRSRSLHVSVCSRAAGVPRLPGADWGSHLRGWRQNNRVENSHQPVRQRERGLQRFKSLRHAARFCSVFTTVCNQFRPGRRALSARNYRTVMRQRWRANGTSSRRRRRSLSQREVLAATPVLVTRLFDALRRIARTT